MKTLEELGISPAPWTAETGPMVSMVYDGKPGLCSVCAASGDNRKADTALIAAAPDLYAALRDAVTEFCHTCGSYRDDDGACTGGKGDCFVQDWRAALVKAGGGE